MSDGGAEAPFGRVEFKGGPSAEQVAAIMGALQAAWPQPAPPARPVQQSTAWRYADRWWNEGRLPTGWGNH